MTTPLKKSDFAAARNESGNWTVVRAPDEDGTEHDPMEVALPADQQNAEAAIALVVSMVAGPSDKEVESMRVTSERAMRRVNGGKYLRDTDWMVIRHLETGKAIPENVSRLRAAARKAIT